MEFKPRTHAFALQSAPTALLAPGELAQILRNAYLHDLGSFYVVEKDGTYLDDERFTFGDPAYKVVQLQHRFELGHTLLIKNLEHWNSAIVAECRRLGGAVNVHLYASPAGGSAFDWHADDRDVYIYMQQGHKTFQLRTAAGEIETLVVAPGQRLFIPYGVQHRAFAQEVPSVHLSFGQWPSDMSIAETYEALPLPAALKGISS